MKIRLAVPVGAPRPPRRYAFLYHEWLPGTVRQRLREDPNGPVHYAMRPFHLLYLLRLHVRHLACRAGFFVTDEEFGYLYRGRWRWPFVWARRHDYVRYSFERSQKVLLQFAEAFGTPGRLPASSIDRICELIREDVAAKEGG